MATQTPTGLILYQSAASSFVQKVKIALREKGIPFTLKTPEDLATRATSGPLRSANPRVEVPVLIDGDLQIFDSTIILEYLEDKWPEPSLRPKTPADRAKARMIEEICDTEYEAVNWGLAEVRWFKRAEGPLAEELERQGKHHIATIQQWLSEKLGENQWFNGEEFGLADAAVAPIVNRSLTLGHGPAPEGILGKWLARARQRPSVAETFAEYEQALPSFALLAERIATGGARREYRSQRLEWMVKAGGVDVVAQGIQDDTIRFTWPDNTGSK